jgi:hypothetical protein
MTSETWLLCVFPCICSWRTKLYHQQPPNPSTTRILDVSQRLQCDEQQRTLSLSVHCRPSTIKQGELLYVCSGDETAVVGQWALPDPLSLTCIGETRMCIATPCARHRVCAPLSC